MLGVVCRDSRWARRDLERGYERVFAASDENSVACQDCTKQCDAGEQRVIEYLNKALRHELAAVNQYWLHYRILANWGYKDFAKTASPTCSRWTRLGSARA